MSGLAVGAALGLLVGILLGPAMSLLLARREWERASRWGELADGLLARIEGSEDAEERAEEALVEEDTLLDEDALASSRSRT
ncbi:MAG: hypothetical protein HYU54_03320 [Actinobacteria bacterium]|nr:hypothetical protein [Actinomycetota bacterium]